jgi:predicted DCC family thiol-disulfide oxidoreductase YuxK
MSRERFDGALSRPHFGQAIVWIALWFALITLPGSGGSAGERIGPATVLWWVPDGLIASPLVYWFSVLIAQVGAALWALQLLVPWSCWLASLGFTAAVAIHHENSSHISHTTNLTALILLIHSAWYQVERRRIAASLENRTFWDTPVYPRWAWGLSLFTITLFHTGAGLSKLVHSGPGWANGVSLQLWVYLWGKPGRLRDFIVTHRSIVLALQSFTLMAETTAILGLWWPRLRVVIGLTLIGFYGGVIATFGYGFAQNAVWVALFMLPIEALASRLARWWRTASHPPRPYLVAGAIFVFLLARDPRFELFLPLLVAAVILFCAEAELDGSARAETATEPEIDAVPAKAYQESAVLADHSVVIFDGVCNLCNGVVDFIIRRDQRAYFRFASNQSPSGQRLLSRFGVAGGDVGTMYLIEGDTLYERSSAALHIASRLRFPWSLLSIGLGIPASIRDAVYDLIAQNRYRLFGRQETCRVPTPDERSRFLDL